ncbi:hypothetical protein C3L33_07364, partial [Rhododendron williamsianum]
MDSDEGKLFIGGIAWETTEETLREHFANYGDVTEIVIMRDKITGRPRGFGFLVFSDPSVLDAVLQGKHIIDGRTVEAKRALSREEQRTSFTPGNSNAGRSSGSTVNHRTKKIFVGGLPSMLTEEEFRQYFETYGTVTDVVIMYDQNTKRPRGFGFITFDMEEAVDRVLHKNFHELSNKLVEVKPALPKEANPGGGDRSGGYQPFGTGANRFLQPQTAGGAYPPYPSYGGPNYGYGAANSVIGYSGYGGYGNANSGFTGPTGAYGNPNTPSTGYVSLAPDAMKIPWSNQIPGYNALAYSVNAGYGATVPWSAMGLSPGGAAAYGYSNYGRSEGSYSDSVGHGTAGGRAGGVPNRNSGGSNSVLEQQGTTGGGYKGSGYGNSNGPSGYSNAAWRSDS